MRASNDFMQACPSIRFVSISQIFPRHAGTSRYYFAGYNDLALNINKFLLQECINSVPPTLRLCRYKEFDFNDQRLKINQKIFLLDGVHLNTLATRSRETRLFPPDAVGPRAVKRGSFTVLFCRAVFLSKRNENSRFFFISL